MTLAEFARWLVDSRVAVVVKPYRIVACACGDANCHGWRLIRAAVAVLAFVALLAGSPAAAQDAPGAWPPEHRRLADGISTAAVWTQIGLATWHAARSSDPRPALLKHAGRVGLTVALAELTKHFVPCDRPDRSDRKSCFSEHTALAVSSAGWNVSISFSLAGAAGGLRLGANKHYPRDVAIGAGVGGAIGYFLR